MQSQIHLTEAQKAEQVMEIRKQKAEIDRALGKWVAEIGWAVKPKIVYSDRGISAALDFEKLSKEQIEHIKKQIEKDEKDTTV